MIQPNPQVDTFLASQTTWKDAFTELRALFRDYDLSEELKWGQPTYCLNGKNVFLIHGFKDYCAILFVKGALMKDPDGLLIQQTEKVQAGRQIRFTSADQVRSLRDRLKSYLQDAIDIEKSGMEVPMKKTDEFPMPEELIEKFRERPELKAAFEKLTPGRQRAYLLYFSDPKQPKTRLARIEKYVDPIMDGKGLYD